MTADIPELWVDEFLFVACKKSNGDTEYSISIDEIENEIKHNITAYIETYTNNIIEILKKNGLIQTDSNDQYIRVTYRGIYYIADKKRTDVTNFNILSISDIRRHITGFLQWIIKKSQDNKSGKVSIEEVQREYKDRLGENAIKQLLTILYQKGSINIGSDNYITITQPSRSFSIR